MKTQDKKNKKKSMLITIGVHSALFLAAMIPVATHLDLDLNEDVMYSIPIEFAEFAQSSDKALKAASPKPDAEVKPVTEEVNEEPEIIEAEQISEIAETTEEAEPVESEVVEEVEAEVVAAEDNEVGEAEEAASAGGTDATAAEGNSAGTAEEGEEEGYPGLDGTGVITRRVIHREDITKVARYSGVIAVNLCIDRRGFVIAIARNEERTTITDEELVRKAMEIATEYRFEKDYSAAKRECGVLTFVFDIDSDVYAEYVFAD
jgi:hypothetical protein